MRCLLDQAKVRYRRRTIWCVTGATHAHFLFLIVELKSVHLLVLLGNGVFDHLLLNQVAVAAKNALS